MNRMGIVYLVGGGPGDPGLMTLRGWECLRRADLILYDGLVNPLLLLHTSANAERTSRTQGEEGRVLNQAEINRRLIDAAKAGKTVVRLKGGDPFIFGRGAEEAQALAQAGIPFEVIPGVSAATAASTYAGISLTHREFTSAVAFVTGHEDPAKQEASLDYAALARFPGTLVFYMGLHRLEAIVTALMHAGKPGDTPAAVISRGTTPRQRTVSATLATLAAEVRRVQLSPPSLIVVGECVRLRETIQWFEKRPLFGVRIGITRPHGQIQTEVSRAMELGAQPVLLPLVEIHPPEDWSPVDEVLLGIGQFDWIVFTSVNGVRFLIGRLWEQRKDLRQFGAAHLAAIGPGTARALENFHLRADLVPDSYRAESLADLLKPHVSGKRVLWARASRGRDVLPDELRAAGARLEELIVYQNLDVERLPPESLTEIEQGDLDWIGLSSPSIARNLGRLLSPAARSLLGKKVRLCSISPVTTAAAQEAGLPISAEAEVFTWDGIFQAISRVVAAERSRQG